MSSEEASDVEAEKGGEAALEKSIDLPAARDLVRTFAKTAKATRLYSRNNEIYQRFWRDLVTRMDAYVEANTVLSMQIGTHDVRVGGEVVFQPKDQDDNFAYRLYKDGLRQIDFVRGLSHEELEDFLGIVTVDFERGEFQDKDVVSLIWEREFKHIFTLSVDSFVQESQLEGQEEEEEPAELDQSAMNDVEVDQLFDVLQQSSEVNLLKLDSEEKREYRQISVGSTGFTEREVVHGGQIFQIDPNLQLRLKAEVEVVGLEDTPTEVIAEILFELFRQATPEDYPMLVASTLGVVDSLIAEADLETINQLLFPLKLLSNPDYARAFLNHGLVQELFSRLGEPSRLEPLRQPLQEGRVRGGISAFFGFLCLQVPERVSGLLLWLDKLSVADARKAGVDALITVAEDDLQPFITVARTAGAALIADVIATMGQVGSMQSLEVILGAATHADPKVREGSLVALRSYESPRAREVIFAGLNDSEELVRLSSLRYMTVHRDRATGRFLVEQVQAKGLKGRSFGEGRAMCMAMAHILGQESAPVLTGLLRNKRNPEAQRAAAHGVAVLGGQDARRLLEQAVRESSQAVADECRGLLLNLK